MVWLCNVDKMIRFSNRQNRIDGVVVSVIPLECDRSCVRARSGQTKDNEIGICCFSGT